MDILIAIAGLGIICLVAEIFNLRKIIVPFTVAGLIALLGYTGAKIFSKNPDILGTGLDGAPYNSMMASDKYGLAFSALFILISIFLVALSPEFHKEHKAKLSDFVAIKLFLLTGAIAMVSFTNLAMFFLGIEILSISLYVLAASKPKDVKSNEAGMKYFLMGAFASGIILFGIALIYGATGTFNMLDINALNREALPTWFAIGTVMMIIGLMFKIAAVPFHFWAPDVYEGSPALTTATMSTLAKVAAMASLFKLATTLNAHVPGLLTTINLLAVLSMTVGNLLALKQTNVKRMLAFSGISHAGYMLLAFQFLNLTTSQGNLLFYATGYALAGIAAFAVILSVCGSKGNEDIYNFNGLGKTHPLLAGVLTCALLSMAGIPIFSGFFGKLFLFGQVLEKGRLILVVIAVINSIISIGYYFKLILSMYTQESTTETEKTTVPFVYSAVAVLSIAINIAIGLYPQFILDLIK
ncbi:NADH-quinone oxidoreductase subunit NuoN [Flavobacterium sp. Sd200]|uniref:NADH-quinone oxidoreductase subunit N n=1 Tax=Flavobacterium sp. Sd200 TaxID=2692211 RepID=UPI001372092E|nr:NADH-quinone oxidoreductase subunit N [Flavobacterium sp. Sd200]MXN91469.1 NADH-quinone oxidoreductase subunit NuoN [Flavobacterium sp. Sd200]